MASVMSQKFGVTSGYDDARTRSQSDPTRRTYFATREFVDWGGPETAAKLAALSIVGGGSQAVGLVPVGE